MNRVKKRYIISFIIIACISIAGLFFPEKQGLYLDDDPHVNAADTAFMIISAILVLLMTPGLAFFYAGMVRAKNVISTMLQSFIAMGIVSIIWVVVGFSLVFGNDINGIIGDPRTFFMLDNVGSHTDELLSPTIPLMLFALFQMKFAILTPSLISGAFAERVRFSAYLLFMIVFTIFIYAPIAHWIWHPNGIFRVMGVVDFAGGLVVHTSSGVAAFAGAIFLGSRNMPANHKPANIPFVMLGVALLWIGWFGFNAGSALAVNGVAIKAFINTNTASAVGMITWVFFDTLRKRKPSAMGACVGAIIGLVAITPSAGMVSVGQSMFIAFITTIICNLAVYKSVKSNIDDALDVFPTHGIGGIIGSIFTGIFVNGLIEGKMDVFLHHILAVVIVMVYTFVATYIALFIINKLIPARVTKEKEELGLDLSQHDEIYGLKALND